MSPSKEIPKLFRKDRPVPRLLYPSLILAAISVTAISALGIAGITGHLPAALANGAAVVNGAPGREVPKPKADVPAAKKVVCASCGVVASITPVEVRGSSNGTGAVIGGIAGAVIGNSLGRGDRTVMTLIGGGAGAYAGNEIEKSSKRSTVWQTAVTMDDGRVLRFSTPAQPGYSVGAQVKVLDGRVIPAV